MKGLNLNISKVIEISKNNYTPRYFTKEEAAKRTKSTESKAKEKPNKDNHPVYQENYL